VSDDRGMQWYAEVGMREEEEQRIEEAKRISEALEAHRKWKEEFAKQQEAKHEME